MLFRSKKRLKEDSWLFFEFFLATELGKTVSELRGQLTEAEFVMFAAYYEVKGEREKEEMDKAKARSRR